MDTKVRADPKVREGLNHLLRALEVASGDSFITSILLVSRDGKRLHGFVHPGLPDAYCAAIEGGAVGPNSGSCGSAAFLGHEVFVTDIARDPHWETYRDVALAHGLRSCWSTPVKRASGDVVATFAIYHREPRSPTAAEVESIRVAGLGILPLLDARADART